MPSITMMKVKIERGAISTILRTSAAISPDSSASPTPIIATTITPTAPKPRKLPTIDVNMKRMPSAESRLRTVVVRVPTSWVTGSTYS